VAPQEPWESKGLKEIVESRELQDVEVLQGSLDSLEMLELWEIRAR